MLCYHNTGDIVITMNHTQDTHEETKVFTVEISGDFEASTPQASVASFLEWIQHSHVTFTVRDENGYVGSYTAEEAQS